MSFTITTDVFCNGRCGHWIGSVIDDRIRKLDARRMAQKAGWVIRGDDARCPCCAGTATPEDCNMYHSGHHFGGDLRLAEPADARYIPISEGPHLPEKRTP